MLFRSGHGPGQADFVQGVRDGADIESAQALDAGIAHGGSVEWVKGSGQGRPGSKSQAGAGQGGGAVAGHVFDPFEVEFACQLAHHHRQGHQSRRRRRLGAARLWSLRSLRNNTLRFRSVAYRCKIPRFALLDFGL